MNEDEKLKALLIKLHKQLDCLFPKQDCLALLWLVSSNSAFNSRTPIQVMLEDGSEGAVAVVTYLDNQLSR